MKTMRLTEEEAQIILDRRAEAHHKRLPLHSK